MKIHTLFTGLALALALAAPARAGIYFGAHQDDIVLLMGRNVQLDIKADRPTVLVVMTAGDAGNGNAALALAGLSLCYYNQIGNPYYRVRHNAHEAAIATWVPAAYSRIPQRSLDNFGEGRSEVEKVRIGNVTIYNLNLPDGHLAAFEAQPVAMLDDVTGANRYSRETLRDTLRQIVMRHSKESAAPTIHIPEHDLAFSAPGYNDLGQVARHSDHPDHTATGRLVRDALAADPALRCLRRLLYMGYGVCESPDAMSGMEKLSQVQAYLALNTVLVNQGNVSFDHARQILQRGSMDSFHTGFYGKQNTREDPGSLVCRVAPLERLETSRQGRMQFR